MHATGHGAFHGPHPIFRCPFREAQDLIAAKSGHFDPGRARLQPVEKLIQHRLGNGRRWQAGDHRVAQPGHGAGAVGPIAAGRQKAIGKAAILVMDGDVEPLPQQARREVPAQIAQPDIAVPHVTSPKSDGSIFVPASSARAIQD